MTLRFDAPIFAVQVEALSRIQIESVQQSSLLFVDLYNMTQQREDQTLEPNDMRHAGPLVVHEMCLQFLRRLCN